MLPEFSQPLGPERPAPTLPERIVALLEVLLCSDYLTQLAIGTTFAAAGYGPQAPGGHLRVSYVVGVSLLDSVLLVGFVLLFLYSHGERPRDVLFGRRPLVAEALHGITLIFAALLIGIVVLVGIRYILPSLHNVETNPLQDLLKRPRDAWLFALALLVAGGIREEVQRAFLLHRFEQALGGRTVGLVVTSIAFGVGHLVQGADAVVATALLGAFWGGVYLRRRSIIAPMVSHAGFDLLQVIQALTGG